MFFSPKISSYSQGNFSPEIHPLQTQLFLLQLSVLSETHSSCRISRNQNRHWPKKRARTWLHSDSGAPATAWRRWKKVWSPCYSEASQNCCNKSMMWDLNGDPVKKVVSEWFQRFCANPKATNKFLAKAAMFEFHDFQATSALRKQHMALYFLPTTDRHREPFFSSWWGKDQPNQRQMTVKLQGTFLGTRWMG